MRRTLSFLILICMLSTVCHAREIPGHVVDASNTPIADASVIISIGDSIAGIVIQMQKEVYYKVLESTKSGIRLKY